ncbi:hypothetical protein D9O50_07015 [Oxalobacteraceae bacterium CAVE-383]|nr:hypothetical protein D9O50_07015 [Oxalobacteraceae bacterium CAVE-383]
MTYKNLFISIVVFLSTSLLSGCFSMSTLEKNATLENDESIFVIGMKPENFRLSVFAGDIKNGEFKTNFMRSIAVFAFPEKGYVVAKGHAGDTLAIISVTPYEKGAFLKPLYITCSGEKMLTFKIPSGKVIYISDLLYSYSGSGIAVSYKQDFDSARQYMDKNYATLQGTLEAWPSEFATSNKECAR